MAFGWDDLAIALVSLGSGALGAEASKDASKAAASGGRAAIAEQQRQFNIAMRMLEPTRALGYGALRDIGSLYGYRVPEYAPLNMVGASPASLGTTPYGAGSSNWMLGSPIRVGGRKAPGTIAGLDANPFSGGNRRFSGTIDPAAGTVLVDAKKAKKRDALSAAATGYLRGDSTELKGSKLKRVRAAIDELLGQGYQWTSAPQEPTAGVIPGAPGTSTAGDFSRFFASPDYQFRLDQGNQAIERSAAARSGVLNPNTVKDLTDFSGNLASGEFANYMNRLFNIAGMGQTAVNQGVAAGANTANNVGNAMLGIGDARASGILGQTNSWLNAGNTALNNWMLKRGGWFNAPAGG